jgi:hypothetical protein
MKVMSSVDKIDKIYVINHGSHCTSFTTYTAVLSEIQIEQNALIYCNFIMQWYQILKLSKVEMLLKIT